MITIIIFTYNRPAYLNRILSYYCDQQWKLPIIIADSSIADLVAENSIIVKSFQKNLQSQHIIYEATISPFIKLAETFKLVSTPYQVLCADDDFVVPSAIMECAIFLNQNLGYSSAMGLYCRYKTLNRINNKSEFEWEPCYTQARSIENKNASERYVAFLSDYFPIFYSVYRNKTAQTLFNTISPITKHGRIGELSLAAISIILGKQKILPILYSFRDTNVSIEQAAEKAKSDLFLSIPSLIENSKSEYDLILSAMAELIQQQEQCTPEAAMNSIKTGMEKYLSGMSTPPPKPSPIMELAKRLSLQTPTWYRQIRKSLHLRAIKKPFYKKVRDIEIFKESMEQIKASVLLHADKTFPS